MKNTSISDIFVKQGLIGGCTDRIISVQWLCELSDWEYQKREKTGKDKYYEDYFDEAFVSFLDNGWLEPYINFEEDIKEIPYNAIGYCLKTKREAEKFYEFGLVLGELFRYKETKIIEVRENGKLITWYVHDEVFFDNPLLSKMIEAAKDALIETLNNEQDNPVFLQFIREYTEELGIKLDIIDALTKSATKHDN